MNTIISTQQRELQALRKTVQFFDTERILYINRYRQMLKKQFQNDLPAEIWLTFVFISKEIQEILINVFHLTPDETERIYQEEYNKSQLT